MDMKKFERTELLMGGEAMATLAKTRVAIFGVGGVGGWCAEALARSGIGHMMLVDFDRVAETNINRQIMATAESVGEIKVEVLAKRLRAINPSIDLDVRAQFYEAGNAATFHLEDFDYVIDAIDSMESKMSLIRHALSIPALTLYSSMGAARKIDMFAIRATDFRKVEGDALARSLRQRFRKTGGLPERRFMCVWSPEMRENKGTSGEKANGTVMHVTAAFGLALASLVLRDIEKRCTETA